MPMEDLLTRQAPHSQEAEQSVLGSMLIDSRCISDVVGVVRPEDFYLQANREIYETMYEMFSYSEVIDPVTVLDKMRRKLHKISHAAHGDHADGRERQALCADRP